MKCLHWLLIGLLLFYLAMLALLAGCVSKSEYSEYEALQAEYEALQGKLQEYDSRLAEAHTYAEVVDVYVDPHRLALALPTKYGWVGPGKSPDFILNFKSKASATGDTELSQMVDRAFALPWGQEKDLVWAEVYLRLAERLLATTKP